MKTTEEEIEDLFTCGECNCESYHKRFANETWGLPRDEWICQANVPEEQCKMYRKALWKYHENKIIRANRSATTYVFIPIIAGASISIVATILYYIFQYFL